MSEVLADPEPSVLHVGFGDSAWDMQLRVWIDDPTRHPIVQSMVNQRIIAEFQEYNVEIPFPQRDLHLISHPAGMFNPK